MKYETVDQNIAPDASYMRALEYQAIEYARVLVPIGTLTAEEVARRSFSVAEAMLEMTDEAARNAVNARRQVPGEGA